MGVALLDLEADFSSNDPGTFTRYGTWAYSAGTGGLLSSTNATLKTQTTSFANKVVCKFTPTNGSYMFCSADDYTYAGAPSSWIELAFKTTSGNNFITMSMYETGIRQATIGSTMIGYAEQPWPTEFSFTSDQTIELTCGTYGWSASILKANTSVPSGGGVLGSTITVSSTTNFPSSGIIRVNTTNKGYIDVTYTGKTSTTFTGCTHTQPGAPLTATGTKVEFWKRLIELPIKSTSSVSYDLSGAYRNGPYNNRGVGVTVPSGTTIKYLAAYSVGTYGNSLSGATNAPTNIFLDDFNRTTNPYAPTNLAVTNSKVSGLVSSQATVAGFTTNGTSLAFTTSTPTFICQKVADNRWPTADNTDITLIKMIYTSGVPIVCINNNDKFSVAINSNISGTTYPITIYYETYTFNAKAQTTTVNRFYDFTGTQGSGATVANTSNTTIPSGSTVWIVLYPKLNSSYPPAVDSSHGYKIAVYVQSTQPSYPIVPTIRSSFNPPINVIENIQLSAQVGYSASISELALSSYPIKAFSNPTGSTYETGVPISHSGALNDNTTLASTELVGGVYLGNDYVYETLEVS